MKILKRILLVLAVIIGIALITALFVKKDYEVTRNITINKPKQELFDYLKYLKNMDNYSRWAKMDPDMKKTYTGTDGTVGFISAWDSDKDSVGKGEQEIKKITEGERIDMEVRFKVPFESTGIQREHTLPVQSLVFIHGYGSNDRCRSGNRAGQPESIDGNSAVTITNKNILKSLPTAGFFYFRYFHP
jgi:hypothetical protein